MPHKEDTHSPAHVMGAINYNSPDGFPEGKKHILLGSASDRLRKHSEHVVPITDIRSCNEGLNLDKNGFQHLNEPTSLGHDDWSDGNFVKEHYYPEAAGMLKRVTGASDVLCMAHIIRNCTFDEVQEEAREVQQREGGDGMVQKMNPARTAHCDQSYKGAEQILKIYFGEERANELMKKRWAIINVWRPLKPIHRDPLAVCDWRSISESEDLIGVDIKLPPPGKHSSLGKAHGVVPAQHMWERWDIRHSSNHKWFYASNMTPDECLLLKIFDSKKDGRARCCPHTAFVGERDEGPARESVELRTLVFWDDEGAE